MVVKAVSLSIRPSIYQLYVHVYVFELFLIHQNGVACPLKIESCYHIFSLSAQTLNQVVVWDYVITVYLA